MSEKNLTPFKQLLVGLKSKPLPYQCIHCQKWVEENDAAMSKKGVMCLDCYTLSLKRKKERDPDDTSPATLARLYQAKQ